MSSRGTSFSSAARGFCISGGWLGFHGSNNGGGPLRFRSLQADKSYKTKAATHRRGVIPT